MNRFEIPTQLSPFYHDIKRLPRKFKKKWKHIMKYKHLDVNQKMWYILEFTNPNYKKFIIQEIIINDDNID